MNDEHEALWKRIQGYSPGYHDASLGFARRLANDNSWTESYALRVVAEYKRFVFLAMTLSHPVTPSDQVDQAWHLHLGYTRDYWEIFCPQVLRRPLHHDPTQGGNAEREKYFDWYAKTLTAYSESFGQPPRDIWPEPQQRFTQRFQRRQIADHAVKPAKLSWVGSAFGLLGLVGVAWGTQDKSRDNLTWIYLGFIGLVVFLIWQAVKQSAARRNKKKRSDECGGGSGCGGGNSDGGSGCGGGGCGGGCGG